MTQKTDGGVFIQGRPIGDVQPKSRPITVGNIPLPDRDREFSPESIARLKKKWYSLYVGPPQTEPRLVFLYISPDPRVDTSLEAHLRRRQAASPLPASHWRCE